MTEIKGYEGHYSITKDGKVWSHKNNLYLNPKIDKDGYYGVVLYKDGKPKSFLVHRLVASTFIENEDNKPQVNHKNGIKNDNRVENLEWCNNSENGIHAYEIGLKTQKGENNANSKLTADEVIAIRVLASKGFTLKEIAKIFDVGQTTISQIKNNKLWRKAGSE